MSTSTDTYRRPNTTDKTACPQVFLRQADPLPEPINGTLRLVFLSDTHGRHEEINFLPEGDVLFHLGDAANRGNVSDVRSFAKWLEKHSFHRERIVIDGNHDRYLYDPSLDVMKEYEGVAHVLNNEVIQVADGKLTVVGVSWAACESDDYSAAKLSVEAWKNATIKEEIKDVDLVLSHIHPFIEGGGKGWHGSRGITNFVKNLNAPLHCFGHIHWTRGVRALNLGTILVNCASTWNEPVVIDYCPSSKSVMMVHCPIPDEELDREDRNNYLKEWLAVRGDLSNQNQQRESTIF